MDLKKQNDCECSQVLNITFWKREVNTFNGLAGDMQIVDQFRYLGVSIDKRLNFNSHVETVGKI